MLFFFKFVENKCNEKLVRTEQVLLKYLPPCQYQPLFFGHILNKSGYCGIILES